MDYPDLVSQLSVRLLPKALGALKPGIIPTAGDIENITHPAYPEYLPMIRYESELHF